MDFVILSHANLLLFLAHQIAKNNGVIRTDSPVNDLVMHQDTVTGVQLEDFQELMAKHVVIAANLGGAKRY